MALETGTYISDLVVTNPTSSDPKSQGDDHLRLIKSTVLATFPNINGAMTSTEEELNILDGATLSTAELNILDGVTASTAELNILDGATLTVTELNYVDGVTSAIQTQIDSKAPLASPALTGTPTAPTATFGASGTQIATLDFVNATSFSPALPAQTSNSGKVITTDGSNASWTAAINSTVTGFGHGADLTKKIVFGLSGLTTATTRTLTVRDENITLAGATSTDALKIYDYTDETKITKFQNSGYTTGTTRTVTLADEDVSVFTPYARLLSTVTASNSATVSVETTFDSTYDMYIIEATGVTVQTNGVGLDFLMKIGGSYVTANYNGVATNVANITAGAAATITDVISNSASVSVNFTMRIPVVSSTAFAKAVYFSGANITNALTDLAINGTMMNTGTGALTGIKFQATSGNIVAGKFRLYGVRNA